MLTILEPNSTPAHEPIPLGAGNLTAPENTRWRQWLDERWVMQFDHVIRFKHVWVADCF